MSNWKQFVKEELLKGTPHGEIRKHLKNADPQLTDNAAQKRVRKTYLRLVNEGLINPQRTVATPAPVVENENIGRVTEKSRAYSSKTGINTLEGKILLQKGSNINENDLLVQYGFDPAEWTVDGYKMSEWESPCKGGGAVVRYAFKLEVTPKKEEDLTDEDRARFTNTALDSVLNKFAKVFGKSKKGLPAQCSIEETVDGVVVNIVITDAHIGMLARCFESGEDYGTEKACEQIFAACAIIAQKLARYHRPIKQILLTTNGDMMHTDNDNQTTTNGTFQHVDKRFSEIHKAVADLIFRLVMMFSEIAPVEYIYIPGNHDRRTVEVLADGLGRVFKLMNDYGACKHEVKADTEATVFKYRIVGDVAIGWTHGDMSNKNLKELMQDRVREKVVLHYLNKGHTHVHGLEQMTGGFMETQGSACPHDAWSYNKGFSTTPARCIVANIWDGTPVLPDRVVGPIIP